MLKQYIARKEHTVVDYAVDHTERVCDHCEKPITSHYWCVETRHNDWGNDSIDSFKHNDYCSPECLREAFENYIRHSNNNHNTQHFEVEHCNVAVSQYEKHNIVDEDFDSVIHEILED